MQKLLSALFLAAITSSAVPAERFVQWHSTNIQLLWGSKYEVGPERRTVATFEHANGWKFGDFFMFVDQTWPESGESAYYTGISPRLSLGKMTGRALSYGVIKDVLIASTLEKPKDQTETYLYGAGVDLELPGFQFFNANAYVRDHPDLNGQTYQLTLAWSRPFKVGRRGFVVEGFADFAGEEEAAVANQLIVPRLLADLGELINRGAGNVWLGIEWQYWRHTFGIKATTESVPSCS